MGRPARGVLRLSEDDQAANTRRERQQRRDHAHDQLLHHGAEHPECAASHLPRLQSRLAVPIPRTVRPPCLAVPGRGRDEGAYTMTKLSGKTALVTGASRGIGRASALALARMGAQVLVHYSSGVKEADAVVAEIRKAGGRGDAVAADLSAQRRRHVRRLCESRRRRRTGHTSSPSRSAPWSATGWTYWSPMP